MTDISYSPFHAHYAGQPGTARPTAPAAQGADVLWLSDLAWGATVGGVVMLVLAAGFTVVGVRTKPRSAVPA